MSWVLVDGERGLWQRRKRKRLADNESTTHKQAKERLARWLADASSSYSVGLEYPFTEDGGGVQSWASAGFLRKPTLAQLRRRRAPIVCICDIVLIEQGRVTTAIEVVHTHYTPEWKERWLQSQGIGVYEAYASVILDAKSKPVSFDEMLTGVSA